MIAIDILIYNNNIFNENKTILTVVNVRHMVKKNLVASLTWIDPRPVIHHWMKGRKEGNVLFNDTFSIQHICNYSYMAPNASVGALYYFKKLTILLNF